MKGNSQVISCLNRYLSIELTGYKQYLLHSRMCGNWGFKRLKEIQNDYSADETNHAGELMERILFLEGQPQLLDMREITPCGTVVGQLELDLDLISQAIPLLREAILECENVHDYVSRDLFRKMLDDEEEHFHWLETELRLIQETGLENYLQSQM